MLQQQHSTVGVLTLLLILAFASIANCWDDYEQPQPGPAAEQQPLPDRSSSAVTNDGYDSSPSFEEEFGPKASPQGTAAGSGVSYIRWGQSNCRAGNKVVYRGLMAGSHYNQQGGGANFVCLLTAKYGSPRVQYFPYNNLPASHDEILTTTAYWYSHFVGRSGPLVPCAACFSSSRSTKLMIPGAINCPYGWTEEYDGYLVTGSKKYQNNVQFECVDRNAQGIGRTSSPWPHGYLYTLGVKPVPGITCPPFSSGKATTCVVCTK